MFVIEQNIAKTSSKTLKKRFFKNGTPLAKEIAVKHTISYKEVTLILGILVAVLVVIILWVVDPSADGQPASHVTNLPGLSPGDLPRSIIYTLADIIF
jgi:hypothetical protein